MNVTINAEQGLFVIPCGNGYTCLGFDVCRNRTMAIAKELGRPDLQPKEYSSLAAYAEYSTAIDAARTSGKTLTCELTPQLIGLEGKRIEVVNKHGERRRFKVGKSTGFIPVHLELANRTSSGGPAVTGAPFKSIRIVA